MPALARVRNGNGLTKEWRAVLMLDPCVYCGYEPRGLDHILAASNDGSDGWQNRAPACEGCDTAKANAPLLFWLWAMERARRRVMRRNRYRISEIRDGAQRTMASAMCRQRLRNLTGVQ